MKRISQRQKQVLEFLTDHPREAFTSRDIADKLEMSRETCRVILIRLYKDKKIYRFLYPFPTGNHKMDLNFYTINETMNKFTFNS